MSEPQVPPRLMLEANLDLIRELTARIARRHRLRSDEAEEFSSYVWLKMIEDDHRILRRFRGRSNLRTFLIIVIHRLFLDFRTRAWGKWRPPAEVQRLGKDAVELDRLLTRDGHSLENAMAILCGQAGSRSREELLAVADRISPRVRMRWEGEEALHCMPATTSADDRLLEGEQRAILRKTRHSLSRAFRELPAQDRLILRMRYQDGLTVRKIASMLKVEDRLLYRRFERCLRNLRNVLEKSEAEHEPATRSSQWQPTGTAPLGENQC